MPISNPPPLGAPARVNRRSPNAHPLLQPLAQAQELLTRSETRAEAASPAVVEGLRARLSDREAAGWLAHAHIWIHPHDLGWQRVSLFAEDPLPALLDAGQMQWRDGVFPQHAGGHAGGTRAR
jgi:hypothetical protein